MNKCANIEIGKLIFLYELDLISKNARKKFELHLFECDYCLKEIYKMTEVINQLHSSKEEIIIALESENPDLNLDTEQVIQLKQKRRFSLIPVLPKTRDIWHMYPKFKLILPIVLVVLALVLLPLIHNKSEKDYSKYLEFEKLSYSPEIFRGAPATQAQEFFNQGMKYYLEEDYSASIELLKKAALLDSANSEYGLYLGVSFYLLKDCSNCISTLSALLPKTRGVRRFQISWYLAQAYIGNDQKEAAIPLLQEIIVNGYEYSNKAKKLLNKLD